MISGRTTIICMRKDLAGGEGYDGDDEHCAVVEKCVLPSMKLCVPGMEGGGSRESILSCWKSKDKNVLSFK